MATKIFITSAKGGAGATTFAIGLGDALAREGQRTLIVDGDSSCADGLFLCGLQGMNVYTLADAKSGACRVKQAILKHPKSENLYILPTLGCDDKAFCEEAVKTVEGLFDYVLCDSAARGACGEAIVVTEPYPSSVKGADDKLARLTDCGMSKKSVVVNKINGGLVFDGEVMTPQETAAILRCDLMGVIPEDLGMPLGKLKPRTKKAYAMCAAKLMSKGDKVFAVIRPYMGLKGAIKRRLRRAL